MLKERIPSIRFNQYSDDWEKYLFSDVANTRRGLTYKPSDISEDGVRVLRSSNIDEDSFKLDSSDVFVSEKAINIPYVKNGDLLITSANGSSRLVGKHAVIDGIHTNSAVPGGFMLSASTENPYFLNASMGANWYSHFIALHTAGGNGSIGNLSKTDLDSQNIFIPKTDEQKKLGLFFKEYDQLLSLHTQKLDKLKKVKGAMLLKMFPQNGSNVPEIRFKGFDQSWLKLPLGKIVTPYADPVPTPTEDYYRLGIRSHAKGTFHNYVKKGEALETAQMHRVAANKLIVNITFAWEHAVAITDENDAGKLVSHRFPQFSFNEGMISGFFKYIIINKKFKHHLGLSSPGGAGRNKVLKIDEMLKYEVYVPQDADEQEKIRDYFEKLDLLITLQQSKVEKLTNMKKALLSKMFV